MTHACPCGYAADALEDLRDHLGEVFIPGNDLARDGRVHFEAAREAGDGQLTARCACGLTADGVAGMDEHLIEVFIPDDGMGLDGNRHLPAPAA
jgi:hypothetical protein